MLNANNSQQTNAEETYAVGVDIGGTKIIVMIATQKGKIVYKEKVKTTGSLEEIYGHIMKSLSAAAVSPEQIVAIGFGVPGVTDSKEGIVIEAPALNWSHVPFRDQMQRYFNKPVFVENDVNCAALGERWIGSARNSSDFVVVAIGTGVGSAIVANGTLVQGSSHMAGEVAYLVLEQDVLDNKSNAFGQFGLFEKKISGVALAQHGILPHILFEQYAKGDEKAISIIHQFVADLSIGIANIVSLLNPKKVILGGGVSQSLHIVIDLIRASVAHLTPIPTEIALTGLGEEAGAVGAVALAFEQMGIFNRQGGAA